MEFNTENFTKPTMPNNLEKSRFTIHDSAFAIVVFILLNIATSFILSSFDLSGIAGTVWYYLLNAATEAIFVLAALIVTKSRGLLFAHDLGMKNKVSWKLAGWCFLVSYASLMFFGNLTNVFINFLQLLGYRSILGDISISTFGEFLGMVVATCVTAAFCEEVLFRGVILSGFRKYGFKVAVFASAFVFMIMHGNAEQTIHQFIVGVIIGVAFFKTCNLWVGVLIHFFNNLIPVTQVFLLNVLSYTQEVNTEAATEVVKYGWGSLVIDLIFAILAAWVGYHVIKWLFKRVFRENAALNGEQKEVETKTSVVIDGNETTVDMSIDGAPVVQTEDESSSGDETKQKEKISKSTIIMFVLSGLYLVGNWILYTVYGFII